MSYNLTIVFHISSHQPRTSCFTLPWSLLDHELELTMCALRMYLEYIPASAVKQRDAFGNQIYVHMCRYTGTKFPRMNNVYKSLGETGPLHSPTVAIANCDAFSDNFRHAL